MYHLCVKTLMEEEGCVLMFFSSYAQSYQHNPWLVHLAGKLLAGDPSINSLIAHNPFSDKPPKCVFSHV